MIGLLNRFAWGISLALSVIPLYFGIEYIMLSLLLLWLMKGLFFSKSSIEVAYDSLGSGVSTYSPPPPSYLNDIIEKSEGEIIGGVPPEDSPVASSQVSSTSSIPMQSTSEGESPEEVIIFQEAPSKFSIYLHSFFSDRPLAKVGGILLFLGALFFLYLVFDAFDAVGKTLIGIGFGFVLIGMGTWLDHRGDRVESRVLFGIGIAVNYLTILSGRYLLRDSIASEPIFSDIFATVALLLNTGLAIVLALVYRSRILLGFAFILAYLTPFLVGSRSSSVLLLSIYTSCITLAISVITLFYARLEESENVEYLQGIAIVGMMLLFSIASIGVSSGDIVYIFIGLLLSTCCLLIAPFQSKKSPLPILIGTYLVLFVLTLGGHTLFYLPVACVFLLAIALFLLFQNILSILIFSTLGGISFLLALIGFYSSGSQDLSLLLFSGCIFFLIQAGAIVRFRSIMLAGVIVVGFGLLNLLGSASIIVGDGMFDLQSIMMIKGMALLLFLGASFFALRLQDAFVYFLAIVMSGILFIMPNTSALFPLLTALPVIIYLLGSFLVPLLLNRKRDGVQHQVFSLIALPISALVVSYMIYQFGQERFPGIAMGLAYILQAGLYLLYAFFFVGPLFQKPSGKDHLVSSEMKKNTLLVLFAVPLSLFTFALAFLFQDVPGMMSLAWIIESSILYMVAVRMQDARIFLFAHGVLLIGLIKEVTLISNMYMGDWMSFGLLIVMCIALFSSLALLRDETGEGRLPHDILHILAMLLIGAGMSQIIPSTGIGWSLFGPIFFLLGILVLYYRIGGRIHRIFSNFLLLGLCLLFLVRFDGLLKDGWPLLVQFGALIGIIMIGSISMREKSIEARIHVTIASLGVLAISSLYIDHFFGTFMVSIALTITASTLIIRGIISDRPMLRTIGLSIGIGVLAKILGYDIWNGSDNLIIRVVALMIAGGVMIYLSQLYGQYVSRGWSEELSLSNIFRPLTTPESHHEEGESPESSKDPLSNH